MNDAEYQTLKIRMRGIASKALLDWLAGIFRIQFALLSESERSLALSEVRKKLSLARKDYSTLALPWLSAEMSDLQAAEFQEAFDDLSQKLEKTLAGENP